MAFHAPQLHGLHVGDDDDLFSGEIFKGVFLRDTGDECPALRSQVAFQLQQFLGAGEILLTSMDCDGMKEGYDLALTAAVSGAVNIPVIASGGAGNLEHLYYTIEYGRADAVLAASIFHFNQNSIGVAKEYTKGRGIPLRL